MLHLTYVYKRKTRMTITCKSQSDERLALKKASPTLRLYEKFYVVSNNAFVTSLFNRSKYLGQRNSGSN